MAINDIFCGECGHVSRAASEDFGRSRDTVVINVDSLSVPPLVNPVRPVFYEPEPNVPPAPDAVSRPSERDLSDTPGAGASVAPTASASIFSKPAASNPAASNPAASKPAASKPTSNNPAPGAFDDAEDLEATRIVRSGQHRGERFVLQFSTGESFTVYGTGLIGRNPQPEPGEYFDQLVRVLDPSRSVSKVHLEFGQEAGSFWVKDRFSGNGTIVREPESRPMRCEPERRFRVARGTRVEMGEQFFIVS
ncbi:MAG: hypothetical protein JWM49_1034 [Microbacteriaceae bacterium]|nr:hypothetical protein [Microbacteriaceae bacterium]